MTAYSTFQSETHVCGNPTANAAMFTQLLQLSDGPVMTEEK